MAEQVVIDIEVKANDLVKAEKRAKELTESISDLQRETKKYRAENSLNEKELAKVNKELKAGTGDSEMLKQKQTELTKSIAENNFKIAENQLQQRKQNSERNNSIKLIKAESKSREQLRAQVSLLTQEYNSISHETEEGRKRSAELQEELKELNDLINEGSKSSGNFKDNIGRYTESIQEAIGTNFEFGGQLEFIIGLLKGFQSNILNASKGATKMARSMKVLKVAFISTGIGAMVIALGSLVAFFQKSQVGAEKIRVVMAEIGAVIKVTIGEIVILGNAIYNLFALDFDEFRRLASLSFTDFADKLRNAITAAADAEIQTIAFEKTVIDLTKALAFLNQQTEIQRAIADDATRSFLEREEAAEKARIASEESAKVGIRLANEELRIFQDSIKIEKAAGTATITQLQQEADLVAAAIDAQTVLQTTILENEKQRRELVEDRIGKDLDVLIDAFDNVKAINERIINNDKNTFDFRKAKLAETKALFEGSFAEQIKTIQKLTDVQINSDDLINESDAVLLNAKIRRFELGEEKEGRLLEIIRDRRTGLQDLAELEEALTNEEIDRKKKANDEIEEILNERKIKELKNAQEIADLLIEIEKKKLAELLKNEALFNEEREALRLKSEKRISEIKKTAEENAKENEAALIQSFRDTFNEIAEISKEFTGSQADFFKTFTNFISDIAGEEKKQIDILAQGAKLASEGFKNVVLKNISIELENIEIARDKKLELAGDDIAARENIEREFNNKKAELLKQEFKEKKAAALFDIAIAGAVAIVKALPNIPLSILAGGLAIIQGGIVASKQPPAVSSNQIFAKGGTIVSGKSHLSGGVNVFGDNGQYFGNVEGGESMHVLKRDATDAMLLSNFNQKFGGKSFSSNNQNRKFQDGGTIVQQSETDLSEVVEAIKDLNIFVKVEDITTAQNSKVKVVNNATI